MIDALKRKLVSTASDLDGCRAQLTQAESVLEVEKREHQLTTTKLTSLLRKRAHGISATEESAQKSTDVGLLHQQVSILQQQLRCAQQAEMQMRERLSASHGAYEKLRLMTLEAFRAQREVAGVPSVLGATGADSKASATATAGPPGSGPSAVVDAVRMALNPPRELSPAAICAELWRRPTEHAQPRVGMPRSRSDLSVTTGMDATLPALRAADVDGHPLSLGAPLGRSRSELATQSRFGGAGLSAMDTGDSLASRIQSSLARTAAGRLSQSASLDSEEAIPVASATIDSKPLGNINQKGLHDMSPVDVIGGNMPFGYAQGAITIEPPKRQRACSVIQSVVQSPRQNHKEC